MWLKRTCSLFNKIPTFGWFVGIDAINFVLAESINLSTIIPFDQSDWNQINETNMSKYDKVWTVFYWKFWWNENLSDNNPPLFTVSFWYTVDWFNEMFNGIYGLLSFCYAMNPNIKETYGTASFSPPQHSWKWNFCF